MFINNFVILKIIFLNTIPPYFKDISLLKSERAKFIMDFLEYTYPETPIPLTSKK